MIEKLNRHSIYEKLYFEVVYLWQDRSWSQIGKNTEPGTELEQPGLGLEVLLIVIPLIPASHPKHRCRLCISNKPSAVGCC
jgi:hypothetical protein